MRSTVASHNQHLSAGEQRTTINRALMEPASHAEAQAEYDTLHAEILDIQGQISARAGTWHEGEELIAWKAWRGKAIAALRAKEARYGFLKRWLHEHGGAAHEREKAARGDLRAIVADIVTCLAEGGTPDGKLALERLVAWQQAWLDATDTTEI